MPERLEIVIEEIEWYDDELARFRFSLPSGRKLRFLPGQFMSLAVEGNIRRSYSFANSPAEDAYLETYVDISPGGPGSRFFAKASIGEEVDALLPLGHFIYIPDDKPVCFVATGTGIVPILSMIEHEMFTVGSGRAVRLIFGVRNESRIMIADRLRKLDEHANFSYDLCLTAPSAQAQWSGFVGRVTDLIGQLEDAKDQQFYLCGSTGMIEDTINILVSKGATGENIHYERFY